MITRFIGIKEFRKDLPTITKDTNKKKQRIIVMRRNEPIFELRPLSKKEKSLQGLMLSIKEGLEDKKKGNICSEEDMEKILALN